MPNPPDHPEAGPVRRDPLTGITVETRLVRVSQDPVVQLLFQNAERLIENGDWNGAINELTSVPNQADDRERNVLLTYVGVCALARGTPAEAKKLFQSAADFASEIDYGWGMVANAANRGVAEAAAGEADAAVKTFEAVLAIARKVECADAEANCLFGLSGIHRQRGNLRSARETARAALAAASRAQDVQVSYRIIRSGLFDFEELTVDTFRFQSRELRRQGREAEAELLELMAEGQAALARRELIEARERFEQALGKAYALGDHLAAGQLHTCVGMTYIHEGDPVGPVEQYQRAREQFFLAEDVRQVARVDATLGLFLARRGDPLEAMPHLLDAFRVCPEYGDERLARDSGRLLVGVLAEVGREGFVAACLGHGLSEDQAAALITNLEKRFGNG